MIHDWQPTANTILSVLSIAGFIWLGAVKFTRLEVKVDTMWNFLLKRAVGEGVKAGFLEANSPVRLINNSGELLEHMAEDLRAWYAKEKCEKLDEQALSLAIERNFGERLLREVCIPNGMSFGTCLLIAVAITKGTDTLTDILDGQHIPQLKPPA